ncbi:T9SS C-terminal target domain-containing protein [Porphyromonas gulae]|uniref:T9SS C-terminal target domain-containing protein n=1 Tax=Porphyromonas gulae TaxID=111105 RepID=UPI0026ED186C|nr:T9SS C-terminal target domain-containing protein [Porphyromonas gulae]
MSKKVTSFALMAALALFAATETSAQLTGRTVSAVSQTAGKVKVAAPQKPSFSQGKVQVSVMPRKQKKANDYGTEVSILKEDFAGFTAGSIGAPDLNTVLTYAFPGECEYPWINFKPGYTHQEGWGAANVWQAGGTICLNADGENFSHLNTPMLNASGYENIVLVRFDARTADDIANQIMIEAAETFNMSPTWDILGAYTLPPVTPDWQTYEVIFYGAGSYSIFNIVVNDHPVYIDNLEVYQIDQHVATPKTLPHSNYKGTSFNANWNKVAGAEGYLLDVFSGGNGMDPEYLLQGQAVNDTTFNVTNAESGKTYYYQVRSRKGTHTSIVSKPMEVFDLETPKMNPVNNLAASAEEVTYTASWNAVPSAERYNYFARFKRTAAADGVFFVTNENFDGIKTPTGELTGWTIENPSTYTYDEVYLGDLVQAGWKGTNYAPYTDYICLDAWQYIFNKKDAGLISPELDLSKGGGKIDLSVKLYATKYVGDDGQGNEVQGYTRAAIALFQYDETLGDYVQSELVYLKESDGLVDQWKVFNVSLTKGTARSVIGIYAVYAPENLYVDDLKISQQYKAGESLLDPFLFMRYVDGQSVDVIVPQQVFNNEMFHQVAAVKHGGQGVQYQGYKISAYSQLESFGISPAPTSLTPSVSMAKAMVKVVGDNIHIDNVHGEAVSIYDLNGRLVYSDNSGNKSIVVDLGQGGAFVVKVGNHSVKLTY